MWRRRRPIRYGLLIVVVLAGCGATAEQLSTPPDASTPNEASTPFDASVDRSDERRVYGPVDGSLSNDADADVATDAATDADADADASDADAADADADADGSIVLTAGTGWSTPNAAVWSVTDGGVTVTGWGTHDHAILVPAPPLAIPAEDYTVYGTVFVITPSEFGLLTRGDTPLGSGFIVFGSKFGGADTTFVGSSSPVGANFAFISGGPAYTLSPNTRYKLAVRVVGDQISAKMWAAAQAEPSWQVFATAAWSTGREVGFYDYDYAGVVLESFYVTVP